MSTQTRCLMLIALGYFDIVSTVLLLSTGGGFYEGNPVVRYIGLGNSIVLKGLLMLGLAMLILPGKEPRPDRPWVRLILGLAVMIYWWVTALHVYRWGQYIAWSL